ncbi:MAG TPA: hypothetical protein VLF18_11415, partial [Tahibacter sp.]|uniref:hypothetical protein n=1 Tax=Tahibacter sp. TaxID=2056211 RepID=UPI002B9C1400
PPSPRPEPSPLVPYELPDFAAGNADPVDMHGTAADTFSNRSPLPGGRDPLPSDLIRGRTKISGPLTVGQLVDVNVSLGCSSALDLRKARVEAITTPQSTGQQVLYALQEVEETSSGAGDWHPVVPGGFQTVDFQNIIDSMVQAPPGSTPVGSGSTPSSLQKTGMIDIATANFGELTDLDANGGVIVLFTKKMNELTAPASSQMVPGMFQSRDLFSSAPGSCPASNESEMLYMMVPDPTGSVNSNVRTYSQVYGNAGPTITHHYEHLLSATRHIYINGAPQLEQMWLDEALAYMLQSLVFHNITGIAPRSNIIVSNLTTGPNAAQRVAAFNTYENPMFGGARAFLLQLGGSNGNKRFGPLRENPHNAGTTPTVHENAAINYMGTSMFLRYLIDRKNTGDAVQLGALLNSTAVGRANLQGVMGAGVDLDDWARDFLIALYTDDAVAGVAPEYTIPTWNYRSMYIALNGTYQLTVNPLTDGVALSNFVLGPGGGTRYARFGIAAGQTATIVLTQGGVSPTAPLTTAIVRTK